MKWTRENIEKMPSMASFYEKVELIERCVVSNPALCVETCKSLIEGVCKTILTNKSVIFSDTDSCSSLVKKAIDSILQTDDSYHSDIIDLGRRIAGVVQKLEEIRNKASFVSHGMDVLNPRLTETISLFGYKVSDTICGFVLNCYINNRVTNGDGRIHYDDCASFNDYFDEQHPMQIGEIPISASEALFEQDYEAYKAAYFEYLSDLASGEIVNEVIDE